LSLKADWLPSRCLREVVCSWWNNLLADIREDLAFIGVLKRSGMLYQWRHFLRSMFFLHSEETFIVQQP
jgi:hypothetical protein